MSKEKLILYTERLTVSPMTDDEMAALVRDAGDPELIKAYGEMYSLSLQNPADRNWYAAWKVCLRDGGARVGDICFKGPPVRGRVEVGYGMDAEGLGYATESVGKICQWALSQRGVYSVYAETEKDNRKSQRVLEKLGFAPCGEGAEGPGFVLEKKDVPYEAYGLAAGAAIGSMTGALSKRPVTGMMLGTALGYLAGFAAEKLEKAKRRKTEKETDGQD